MKILILTGSYAPETGGIAALVRGYAEGLAVHGIRAHILSSIPGSSKYSSPELPVREFTLPPRGYLRRIAACRQAALAALQTDSFQRILTSSWSPFAVQLPARVAGRRIPLDILCHGMDLLEPGRSLRYRLVMRRTLRRASLVVANSRYTAQIAAARGARQKQIVVIQPGVDPNRYLPGPRQTALLGRYQIDAEVPVLVSVGRLIPRKGFDIVLQALPEILRSFPEAVYLIVGDGPDRERLAALANSLSVQRNVRFATEVPDDALPAYYQSADAFVMPSRVLTESGDAEGFGMVFLEAGCCELPVIGGRSGGIEDAVVDGVTGYLVDPASPVECADKIAALLSNPQLRKQMGTRARQRAVEEYQWTQVAGRYLEALGRNCFES